MGQNMSIIRPLRTLPSLAWRPKISLILGWNFLCCIWIGGAFMLCCSCDSCGGGPSLEGTTFAFGLGDMLLLEVTVTWSLEVTA